ncbi:hypothetical protein SAMN05443248_5704 [Bradyrhizobium erythrophlei]|uniref:Uncharacterized protein n=1 Tax=Bradyrhizobium erythrophlei TaxID=1437360 RepID=A0A1M5V1M7_9BRAD|nr:hypothetical protein SAMN05443248_5704 [Bradyrhizobium erythrophlei]
MVLTAYFALSPVIGFLVTVALRKMARAPGRAQHTSARLDAGVEASGPHDFTVRISAVRQHAVDCSQMHKCTRPAITCMPNAAASTASRPNVRDDGQRPSLGAGRGQYRVIWDFGKTEYFFRHGLTPRLQNSLTGKSVETCVGLAIEEARIELDGERAKSNAPSLQFRNWTPRTICRVTAVRTVRPSCRRSGHLDREPHHCGDGEHHPNYGDSALNWLQLDARVLRLSALSP